MSAQSTIAVISSALGLINTEIPVVLAAYQALHAIWAAANPGKTEAEFIASLRETALGPEGAGFSSAWLVAHGYRQDADGTWKKV